jgi:hypothetical protein
MQRYKRSWVSAYLIYIRLNEQKPKKSTALTEIKMINLEIFNSYYVTNLYKKFLSVMTAWHGKKSAMQDEETWDPSKFLLVWCTLIIKPHLTLSLEIQGYW